MIYSLRIKQHTPAKDRRDSWIGQEPNTTSKPDSVANFQSSLLETIPLFIPNLLRSARIHLQKGLPEGNILSACQEKKGQEFQHLVQHYSSKSLHPEPHYLVIFQRELRMKESNRLTIICHFYICPMRNLQFSSYLHSEFCPGLKKSAPERENRRAWR